MNDASDTKPDSVDARPDHGTTTPVEQPPGESASTDNHGTSEALADAINDSTPERRQRSAGAGRSWFALLLSLAAVGAVGWLIWQEYAEQETVPDPAIAALQVRIDDLQRSLRQTADQAAAAARLEIVRALESRIAAVEQVTAEPDRQSAALLQRLERIENGSSRSLEQLTQRLADAEQAAQGRGLRLEQLEQQQQESSQVSEVDRSLDRANAERAVLTRIESLLLMAQDRLELLGDVQTARKARDLAIDQVERLGARKFEPLLQRLRAERDALDAIAARDDAADISALFAAADEVLRWPTRLETGLPKVSDDTDSPASDAGWRDRLGRAFERLVRVERVEIEHLDAAELEAQRRSLSALLATEALAVARRDREVTGRLAAEAQVRVRTLFDSSNPPVGQLIRHLEALARSGDDALPSLEAAAAELRRLLEAGQ